ncbi:MAG: hypothetical protein WD709_05570 [Gammaproteobacteria bacterium]
MSEKIKAGIVTDRDEIVIAVYPGKVNLVRVNPERDMARYGPANL